MSGEHRSPTTIDESSQRRSASISIVTQNAALLPIIPLIHKDNANRRRLRLLCKYICEMCGNVDIVCMQEVFEWGNEHSLKRLVQSMHRAGFRRVITSRDIAPPRFPFGSSGLLLASRQPVLWWSYHTYETTSWFTADAFSQKSCVAMLVAMAGESDRHALVVTTHLQSDYKYAGQYAETRHAQLHSMRSFVDRCVNIVNWAPSLPAVDVVVYTGDFNIRRASDEYTTLVDTLGVTLDAERDVPDKSHSCGGMLVERSDLVERISVFSSVDSRPECLDYVLARAVGNRQCLVSTQSCDVVAPRMEKPLPHNEFGEFLSDHPLLHATLRLDNIR